MREVRSWEAGQMSGAGDAWGMVGPGASGVHFVGRLI